MFHDSGVLFNTGNVLETVKGVEDWWSKGDEDCVGGGLGYWLAVSSEKRGLIQRENADPDVQKRKLIECWREHDFASWHWLSRAIQRVGLTQLASLITTYQHPLTGTCMYAMQNVHVHENIEEPQLPRLRTLRTASKASPNMLYIHTYTSHTCTCTLLYTCTYAYIVYTCMSYKD